MEQQKYEYENLRICKKGLQIESCRRCLFEALCHYEKMIEENNVKVITKP